MQAEKIKVLYADGESHARAAFETSFSQHYEIFTASSMQESLDVLDKEDIHIVVADHHLQRKNGSGLLEIIAGKYPDVIKILLTNGADIETVIDAVNRFHVHRYIVKPWKKEEMQSAIESCCRNFQVAQQRKQQLAQLMRRNEQLEFMLREKLIS